MHLIPLNFQDALDFEIVGAGRIGIISRREDYMTETMITAIFDERGLSILRETYNVGTGELKTQLHLFRPNYEASRARHGEYSYEDNERFISMFNAFEDKLPLTFCVANGEHLRS